MKSALKEEVLSYTVREKRFFLLAFGVSFLIMADYAIVKPVSTSIFLAHYSAQVIPYAWLLGLPLNFAVVSLYNRLLARYSCFQLFCFISSFVAAIHILAGLFGHAIPGLPFFLYLWKDLYIMLMLQQIWSVVHSSTQLKRAKYMYGMILGIGTFGSGIGSACSAALAVKWGSESLLLLSFPLHLVMGALYWAMVRFSALEASQKPFERQTKRWKDFLLIKKSATLQLILMTVVLMQLSTNLIEYQFQSAVEIEIPDQDLRTAFTGKVWSIVHVANLAIKFVVTFLLVHFLGVARSQFFVPALLFLNGVGCIIYPGFAMMTCAFGVVKAIDYSAFNLLKEMLYIPLSKEAKFKARALIDIFAYRASKTLASLVIIGLGFFLPGRGVVTLHWSLLGCYGMWIYGVYFFTRRAKRDASFTQALEWS